MNYLKIGQASDLSGKDRRFYRFLEILPGFLSWATLILLLVGSFWKPVWVAFFIIAFDVYWLLLVAYLGVLLIASYRKLKKNSKIDWKEKTEELTKKDFWSSKEAEKISRDALARRGVVYKDIIQLVFLPNSYEGLDIIRPTMKSLVEDNFPSSQMIVVFACEERAGQEAVLRAEKVKKEFGLHFRDFLITVHPDGIEGEIKGKGANQAYAAEQVKKEIIDKQGLDYDRILVSVFDIDTIITRGYFYRLTYLFLTVENPFRASYQPVPFYYNNLWESSFFARVASTSNSFWQMMQQIRQEKLATYSSHSMTWRALVEAGFWSTNMVSEDSRIFWHCFCHYKGDYRVEPMYFPVSMDVTMDATAWKTVKSLYKQQRRWGWGVENVPYLIFNTTKLWPNLAKKKFITYILVQIHGFHSWATNALIIGVIGWMPIFLGGERFNSTVLSGNLPYVTRTLMTLAMGGLVLSAIVSMLLLPKRPSDKKVWKKFSMFFQWLVLPISIIIFGAIPSLEAQTRLMINKRLGFQVTPKGRQAGKNNWDQD